ncbi:uncharacterized protein [Magallana gigas]|uniref:uncharacterized protein isoform X2 n=1 Tax=Magallana gigas TaxID=29159 RepID=UPI00333F4DF3
MDEDHRRNEYQSIHLGRISRILPGTEDSEGTEDKQDSGAGEKMKEGEKLRVALPENYLQPLEAKALVHLSQKMGPTPKTHLKGSLDVDQVSPEFPMQSSGEYRPISTAKTYDYADCPHQYEELPHLQLRPNGMSPDSVDTHSSNGTTVTSGIHSEHEEGEGATQSAEKRKRFNPLYDTMINTSPTIYNKVNTTVKAKQDHTVLTQLRLMKLAILLLILISIASLFISVYVVIAFSDGPTKVASLQKELQSLKSNYTTMNIKMRILESLVAGNKSFEYINDLDDKLIYFQQQTKENISSLNTNLSNTKVTLQQVQDQVSFSYQNLTSIMASQNSIVQEQLLNISKMEGPQGPQGVGNLSACFMKTDTASSPSDTTRTSTLNPFPPMEDFEKYVVMFVTCSMSGGLYHTLNLTVTDSHRVQYQCMCSGQVSGESIRKCQLHVWLCPRLS